MYCPECGKRMLKKNNVWECPNCGCNFIKNNNDISNKINDYQESNDMVGKIIDGIGNVAEHVSVQVKKEGAYIKNRNNKDSTVLVDDNELILSKVVLDGVDFVNNDTLYHLKAYRVSLLDNSFRLSVHSEIKYVSKEELLTLEMVPSDLMLINKLIGKGII